MVQKVNQRMNKAVTAEGVVDWINREAIVLIEKIRRALDALIGSFDGMQVFYSTTTTSGTSSVVGTLDVSNITEPFSSSGGRFTDGTIYVEATCLVTGPSGKEGSGSVSAVYSITDSSATLSAMSSDLIIGTSLSSVAFSSGSVSLEATLADSTPLTCITRFTVFPGSQ